MAFNRHRVAAFRPFKAVARVGIPSGLQDKTRCTCAVVYTGGSADDTDRAGLLNRQEPRASESRSSILDSNQSPSSIDLPRPWCRQA